TLARRSNGPVHSLRAQRVPVAALLVSLALVGLLALGKFDDTVGHVTFVLSVALGGAAALWLAIAAIRDETTVPLAGWVLLVAGGTAGAIWWFAGSGRPDGPDPAGIRGLWPVDGAGIIFWVSAAALVLVLGLDSQPVAYQRAVVAALGIIGL